jgi:hypothetical protein
MKAYLLYKQSRAGIDMIELSSGPILKYCPNCHYIDDDFFPYNGSRYGLITRFSCAECSRQVTVVDGDCRPPIRYYSGSCCDPFQIDLGTEIYTVIGYERLYGLSASHFKSFEKWSGLSLIPWGEDLTTLDLDEIVHRAEQHVRERYGHVQAFGIDHPFLAKTPEVYGKWMSSWFAVYEESKQEEANK